MSGLPPITPWPPLITAASQPAWMLWRDRALSLSMWLLLALLCRNALATLSAEAMFFLDLSDVAPPLDFREHWRRMQPYWTAVGVLMVWLGIWALVWSLRRFVTKPRPMPLALDPTSEAARHGADAQALLAWRDLPIAIVHVTEGRMHAVAPEPADPKATS